MIINPWEDFSDNFFLKKFDSVGLYAWEKGEKGGTELSYLFLPQPGTVLLWTAPSVDPTRDEPNCRRNLVSKLNARIHLLPR